MKPSQSACLILVLLLLHHITVSRSERFEVLGPAEPVVAVLGEDVVLPCYLRPNISAENFEVRWFRNNFTEFVLQYQDFKTLNENQIPNYRRRTALCPEELKKGNVSLRLSAVRGSDGGRYTCYVQSQEWFAYRTINVVINGWKRRRRYAADVTLDPDTAHPCLILSEDGKHVRCGDTWQDLPDNPERFTQLRLVLGKEGFDSGKHYWEVQVSKGGWWALGVARESAERKFWSEDGPTLCPNGGFWTIEATERPNVRNRTEYWALLDPRKLLNLKQKPQKVGVYVDYEGGQVSFYNVEAKSHMYTFRGLKFTEKLYPLFGTSDMGSLIITPVSHTE